MVKALIERLPSNLSRLLYERFDANGLLPLHYAIARGHLDAAAWFMPGTRVIDRRAITVSYSSVMVPGQVARLNTLTHDNPLVSGYRSVTEEPKDNNVTAWHRHELTPLHLAAIDGNLAAVQVLMTPVKRSESFNTGGNQVFLSNGPDVLGNTPLLYAISHEHLEVVKFLLEKREYPQEPINLTQANNAGVSPLRLAVKNNQPKTLDLLLSTGGTVPETNLNEAVLLAVLGDHPELLAVFKAHGLDLASLRRKDGGTLLHVSAAAGSLAASKWLVEQGGLKVTSTTDEGELPLHVAGSREVTEYLLQVDPQSIDAWTNNKRTPAHTAAARNATEVLTALLAHRPKLAEARDSNGRTPLVLAVQAGSPDATRLLLAQGGSPSLVVDGSPLLLIAVGSGNTRTVEILLRGGAEIGAVDQNGATALHLAALNGMAETVKLLLAANPKPSVDAKTASGHTPLHCACLNGDESVVRLLLEAGADPKCKVPSLDQIPEKDRAKCMGQMAGTWGMSPVDIALENTHHGVVRILRARTGE
jgi:ankyrin repeat protein